LTAALMRHLALLLFCASALAAAEPAAKNPDTVLYPRAAAEPSAAAADGDRWNRIPWLFGALALAAGGTWWLWRSRAQTGPGGRREHKLAIDETRSLGNRQYLVVAAYDGKKLLLGVTPGRINLLCELANEEEVP
jgi:flagellar protein FliO/FliZ